jgi:hypothetical protein
MMTQEDPLAKYRQNFINRTSSQPIEVPQDIESKQPEPMMESEDPLSKYRQNFINRVDNPQKQQPPEEGSSFFSEGLRHIGRTASRAAETIYGIPGDLQSLVDSGLQYAAEKLLSPEKFEKVKGISTRMFPTSGELKEKSQEISNGLTTPQGSTEEFFDKTTETLASLVGPMKFRKAFGVALGSELAKKGLEIAGLGEGSQEAGKLGTMFLLSVANPKGAMKYASKQYDIAENLAKGASVNGEKFQKELTSMIEKMEKGFPTREKNAVLNPAENLLKKIDNGNILVEDLMAAKRDVNSVMGDPETLKGAKKYLKGLGRFIDDAIKPFEKDNPAFSKAYRPANEIYGTVMQGGKAANFIEKTLGAKSVIGAALAEVALGHPEALVPTIAGSIGVHAAAKTVDFFTRMAKSPELRKYYNKALLAAAREDSRTLLGYEKKIENYLKTHPSNYQKNQSNTQQEQRQ